MAIAAEKDMVVEQLDVTTAYLNGKLKERILMEILKHISKGLELLSGDKSRHPMIQEKAREMLHEL